MLGGSFGSGERWQSFAVVVTPALSKHSLVGCWGVSTLPQVSAWVGWYAVVGGSPPALNGGCFVVVWRQSWQEWHPFAVVLGLPTCLVNGGCLVVVGDSRRSLLLQSVHASALCSVCVGLIILDRVAFRPAVAGLFWCFVPQFCLSAVFVWDFVAMEMCAPFPC